MSRLESGGDSDHDGSTDEASLDLSCTGSRDGQVRGGDGLADGAGLGGEEGGGRRSVRGHLGSLGGRRNGELLAASGGRLDGGGRDGNLRDGDLGGDGLGGGRLGDGDTVGDARLGDGGLDDNGGVRDRGDGGGASDSDARGDGVDVSDDTRVLRDERSADALEELDGLGDDVVGLTVGVEAGVGLLDELLVGAEARDVEVVLALLDNVEPGVQALGDNVGARKLEVRKLGDISTTGGLGGLGLLRLLGRLSRGGGGLDIVDGADSGGDGNGLGDNLGAVGRAVRNLRAAVGDGLDLSGEDGGGGHLSGGRRSGGDLGRGGGQGDGGESRGDSAVGGRLAESGLGGRLRLLRSLRGGLGRLSGGLGRLSGGLRLLGGLGGRLRRLAGWLRLLGLLRGSGRDFRGLRGGLRGLGLLRGRSRLGGGLRSGLRGRLRLVVVTVEVDLGDVDLASVLLLVGLVGEDDADVSGKTTLGVLDLVDTLEAVGGLLALGAIGHVVVELETAVELNIDVELLHGKLVGEGVLAATEARSSVTVLTTLSGDDLANAAEVDALEAIEVEAEVAVELSRDEVLPVEAALELVVTLVVGVTGASELVGTVPLLAEAEVQVDTTTETSTETTVAELGKRLEQVRGPWVECQRTVAAAGPAAAAAKRAKAFFMVVSVMCTTVLCLLSQM